MRFNGDGINYSVAIKYVLSFIYIMTNARVAAL